MSEIIKVNQLSKSFGDKQALKNIDFSVEKGAPVALVGPNGAGKTTLFSLLCGYIRPSQGVIEVLGSQPGSAALFGRLSALPQDALLDPRFSIGHQLQFYARLQGMSAKESRKDTERTLAMVGLSESIKVKPSELSHGMRKRATIAQSLLGAPEIVMLDEATAGLDPINAREVREVVASLSNEVTFILSSHDLSELERLCQRVLFLENGILQQHERTETTQTLRFITLRMRDAITGLQAALNALPEISEVKLTQDKEFLISIDMLHAEAMSFDIKLLSMLHNNQWQYAQITNGKTLENQLF
jgi:ABC-type multidrug transport system ATPase subunit